ncbi:MAG: DUF1501 domain-containing protein [Isosphaeraceae bacterium]
MLTLPGRPFGNCEGMTRRTLLRAGALGMFGVGLPGWLRAKEEATRAGQAGPADLSVILVWLDGGPPQHETYDPKPDAPVEYRGPLMPIETAVPGIRVSEMLPYHARMMDRMSLIRSMHHNNGDHFAAAHWMLTGYLGSNAANLAPQYPSAGSIIAKLKGARKSGMPAYVGLPNTHSVGLAPGYHGAAYLGVAYNPFSADGDPNNDAYKVPNLDLPGGMSVNRLDGRRGLLSTFDQARRDADASGLMDGLDRFGQQAYDMISGPAARAAFDLKSEDPRLRDRYGRHQWGQSALLARRLVESGVRFVTLTFGGWDWHSSLERLSRTVLPVLDNAVGSLVDDLETRGLLDSTAVIVMGEFGRTPRINTGGVPGSDPIPGRDHWGEVMSVLVAGGGFAQGKVIGSSNSRGEFPRDNPIKPQDFLATLYRRLGLDADTTFINRPAGPSRSVPPAGSSTNSWPEPDRPAIAGLLCRGRHPGSFSRSSRRVGPARRRTRLQAAATPSVPRAAWPRRHALEEFSGAVWALRPGPRLSAFSRAASRCSCTPLGSVRILRRGALVKASRDA